MKPFEVQCVKTNLEVIAVAINSICYILPSLLWLNDKFREDWDFFEV